MPTLKHDPTQRMFGTIIYVLPGQAHDQLGNAIDAARASIADTAARHDAWLIGKLRAEWSRVDAAVQPCDANGDPTGPRRRVRALLVESDVGTHVDAILQLEREASS